VLTFVLAISKNKLWLKYRVTFLSKHACSAEVAGTKTNTILGGKFVTQKMEQMSQEPLIIHMQIIKTLLAWLF
jgi:hypothetical protein